MSELGTKDVLEQVDTRLGNVEQDIRQLRSDIDQGFTLLRSEMNGRLDRLEGKFDSTTRWLVGLMLFSWLSLMVSIWLKG